MSLIGLVVTLIVVGVLLYCVESLLPIDATIKRLIQVVVILVVCIWLLRVFGLLSDGPFIGGPGVRIR